MLTSLVLTYFLQLNLIFLLKEDFQKWREAFVKSVTVLFTIVVISTELLSYFYLLKSEVILGWWILLNIGSLVYLYFSLQNSKISLSDKFSELLKSKSIWFDGALTKTVWIFISITYLIVLFTGICAPPNTVDVLVYHLPRVAHWIQSGSVEFYQTNIERQLFNAPLCEYFLLHLQLLAGSDRFANLVPFLAYLTGGVITSLISQRLKLDNFGQILTAFISASIPMAILQGSSAKNDLVVALFVVAFFYYFMKALDESQKEDFFFAGLTLGLAILAKGNAYFFCFPIGVLILLKFIIQHRLAGINLKLLVPIFAVLLIAVSLNFGHFYRNWQLYGTPIKGEERLKNEQITVPIVVANLVRNYSTHLATVDLLSNGSVAKAITNLLGDELNNPASTLEENNFRIMQEFRDDVLGNTVHILFLTVAIFYVFLSIKEKQSGNLLVLALSIIFGFLLFCIFLKWNILLSRVHSPLFLLGSPLIAFLATKKISNILSLFTILFFLNSISVIHGAIPRSLIPNNIDCVYSVPRSELYFSYNRELGKEFEFATDFLKKTNTEEIGLDLSDSFVPHNWGAVEYPYWIQLKDNFTDKPYLRHIGVDNPSNRLKQNTSMPEWVLSTKKGNIIENTEYEEVWAKNYIRILRKKNLRQ